MIQLRFFASLRESAGEESREVVLPREVTTVSALCDWLAGEQPELARAFAATPQYRVAINEELAQRDSVIRDGDVVALFPPVTGG